MGILLIPNLSNKNYTYLCICCSRQMCILNSIDEYIFHNTIFVPFHNIRMYANK